MTKVLLTNHMIQKYLQKYIRYKSIPGLAMMTMTKNLSLPLNELSQKKVRRGQKLQQQRRPLCQMLPLLAVAAPLPAAAAAPPVHIIVQKTHDELERETVPGVRIVHLSDNIDFLRYDCAGVKYQSTP